MLVSIRRGEDNKKLWVYSDTQNTHVLDLEDDILRVLNVHPSVIYHEIVGDIRKAYVQQKLARVLAKLLKCRTREIPQAYEKAKLRSSN
jgi:hypothetical protein